MDDDREAALDELARLHAAVDARAAELAARHGPRLRCGRGCAACCIDEVRVFEVEAERIRRAHPGLLRDERPHARGACAFLDEAGACRIYAVRPYVCRTQGLPLRWLDEARGIENRDICALNEPGEPALEELDREDCWPLGPVEERLQALQLRFSASGAEDGRGTPARIALRALFGLAGAGSGPTRAARRRPLERWAPRGKTTDKAT